MIEEKTTVPNGRTLGGLIDSYQTDPVSTFHGLRYHVRDGHRSLLRRHKKDHGHILLSEIRARDIKVMNLGWSEGGKLAIAHAFMTALRVMCGYGTVDLEDPECERLCLILSKIKTPCPPPREVFLSIEQAEAICVQAHLRGWPSMALAQAFQFECMLRQKDVIGEWVPENEPGEAETFHRGYKWFRGLRWSEINDDLILTHVTSKRQKQLVIDLKMSPMVLKELPNVIYRTPTGPVILNEITGMPWSAAEFRRKWRILANQAGIPKEVRNMDTRAGAITEATQAGANLEHIKHAATHSDIAMTQRYARDATVKIAGVQAIRSQYREVKAGGWKNVEN